MNALVLTVRFACELAALVAFAIGGAEAGLVLAIVLPILGATLWGRLAAPKSPTRLADPARLAFELAFFGAATAAAAIAGATTFAVALGVAAICTSLAVRRVAR